MRLSITGKVAPALFHFCFGLGVTGSVGNVWRQGAEDWVEDVGDEQYLVVEAFFADRFEAFLASPGGPFRLGDRAVAGEVGGDSLEVDAPVGGDCLGGGA